MLIRGAAGSGKTTTALLRLRALIRFFANRKRRNDDSVPIYVLVLTYNRTLRGYIDSLTRHLAMEVGTVELEVSTFSRWALRVLSDRTVVRNDLRTSKIRSLGSGISLPADFLIEEVDYVLGRFLPDSLRDYITTKRESRGISPRVDRALRERIINQVITPYTQWKQAKSLCDWNDLATSLVKLSVEPQYDIIIADETQDFSANEVRAIRNQLAAEHSLTFVLDSAQRIYARGFNWTEVGIAIRPESIKRLAQNYRNTVQIARFARGLLNGVALDDDATLPDLNTCSRHGPVPILLEGGYAEQARYAIKHIHSSVDLENESVAFLHPLGGGWFDFLRSCLAKARIAYVELTRQSEWPEGEENVALSTLSSAKGLEFDHVIILGLNAEVTRHGDGEDDDRLTRLRKLLAMGVTRARNSVILGYKAQDASRLVGYFQQNTFEAVKL